MAGISDVYPPDDPDVPAIVRGDPLVIPVTFAEEADLTGWTFRCQVRPSPDGELLATATVTVAGNTALIAFTGAQTALFTPSAGLDLEQITPVTQTWWIVRRLRIEKDFSHD